MLFKNSKLGFFQVPPSFEQQVIFFKFVGRIDSGSGQQEGVGIKGFNIHSPVWA